MLNDCRKNNTYLHRLRTKELRQHLRYVFERWDVKGSGLVPVRSIEESARLHFRGSDTVVAAFARTLEPCAGQEYVSFERFHASVIFWLHGSKHMLSPGVTVLPSQQECEDQRLMTTSMETDSAIGGSASPDTNGKSANLSQCSSLSDGESFECYGEGDEGPAPPEFELGAEDYEEEDGSSPSYSPRKSALVRGSGVAGGGSPSKGSERGGSNNSLLGLQRNAWARSSLRRAQQQSHGDGLPNRRWGSFRHSGKRLGSNALASQLYRSSSFNSSSSGRGSGSGVSGGEANCDEMLFPEDPSSLEEGVLDLNHKIQILQQQVSALADNQSNTDDKYMRAKQDNATLQARVVMLEEQLREVELRSAERLQEEARRNREAISRLEREKQLELENCHYRLKALEKECSNAVEEANRLRSQVDRLRKEAAEALIGQDDARTQLESLQKQATSMQEAGERDTLRNAKLVEELNSEVERLRAEAQALGVSQSMAAAFRNRSASVSSTTSDKEAGRTSYAAELQGEIQGLREENRALRETNEDLEAQLLTLSLEQGRTLLLSSRSGGIIGEEDKANSLAAELEAMSQDESVVDSTEDQITIEKLRNTLREQQEVNSELRAYIDGILLNIVENYPQLLEVKRKE